MKAQSAGKAFAFESSTAAIEALIERLSPVAMQTMAAVNAMGRVLAEPIIADRPSPACDVSAMDGYAVRLADLSQGRLHVSGEVFIGQAPPTMPQGAALRIFTGGPVPAGAEAIIPREQLIEHADAIALPDGLTVKPQQHIRRRGENGSAGETIVEAGTVITPTVAAAMSAFGVVDVAVYRRVRIRAIVTGNEVRHADDAVAPWQLRDSNGPALAAMFSDHPWIDWQGIRHVSDDIEELKSAVAEALVACDALLLTGGVSMGDYDFVPGVLAEHGCQTVFHGLPIRPGKPILGAVGPAGQAVLGLPGNPVSVMTTARRIAVSVLRHTGGFAVADAPTAMVMLSDPSDKRLALCWSRPVKLIGQGRAMLVASQGSGDMISGARSDGFVEIPANEVGVGPWPFYRWRLDT